MASAPLFSAAGRELVARGNFREHPDYYRGYEQALWEQWVEDHCSCEERAPADRWCPVHGDPEVIG